MKNSILFLLLSVFATNVLQAQTFPQKSMNVSIGYGFINLSKSALKSYEVYDGFHVNALGPLHAKFEYMTTDHFGVGLSLNYIAVRGEYDIDYSNGSGQVVSGKEGVKFKSLSALARVNYYYFNDDHIAIYSGLGVGYRSGNWSDYSDDPNFVSSNAKTYVPVGLEFTSGIKGIVAKNLGAYAEVGLSKSVIQLGLVYKLGKQD